MANNQNEATPLAYAIKNALKYAVVGTVYAGAVFVGLADAFQVPLVIHKQLQENVAVMPDNTPVTSVVKGDLAQKILMCAKETPNAGQQHFGERAVWNAKAFIYRASPSGYDFCSKLIPIFKDAIKDIANERGTTVEKLGGLDNVSPEFISSVSDIIRLTATWEREPGVWKELDVKPMSSLKSFFEHNPDDFTKNFPDGDKSLSAEAMAVGIATAIQEYEKAVLEHGINPESHAIHDGFARYAVSVAQDYMNNAVLKSADSYLTIVDDGFDRETRDQIDAARYQSFPSSSGMEWLAEQGLLKEQNMISNAVAMVKDWFAPTPQPPGINMPPR